MSEDVRAHKVSWQSGGPTRRVDIRSGDKLLGAISTRQLYFPNSHFNQGDARVCAGSKALSSSYFCVARMNRNPSGTR